MRDGAGTERGGVMTERRGTTSERRGTVAERRGTLVLCAHGTRSAAGAATVRRIARKVARERDDLDVIRAYVDIQSPQIGDLAAMLSGAGRRPVVVPLLLCAGFHVQVDIADAVRRHGGVAAAPLGPDPALADLLVRRLTEAGARPGDGVVLASAGSSRPDGRADARAAADLLAQRWPGPVTVGFGASDTPTVAAAVGAMRARAGRVAVASYLIGPGHFYSVLRSSEAEVVTAPLGADDTLVQLVLDRYAVVLPGPPAVDYGALRRV